MKKLSILRRLSWERMILQMINKYYTPSIEEFHVGFEYEYRHKDYVWENYHKYNTPELDVEREDCPFSKSDLSEFRVKYLDKEDIESLGWILNENKTTLGLYENTDWWFIKNKYQLRWFENNAYNAIFIISPNNLTLFDGSIKNKSELKVLMKQLKIN
jgi:hypothetical protein